MQLERVNDLREGTSVLSDGLFLAADKVALESAIGKTVHEERQKRETGGRRIENSVQHLQNQFSTRSQFEQSTFKK